MWLRVVGLSIVIGAGGCGGVVERDGRKDGEAPPGEPAPADGANPDGTDDGGWDASTPLDMCMTGFDRDEEPERSCNWVAEGRCYEEKLDACACTCPGGTAVSTCSSGFPEENGAVEVYCQ